MEAKELRIGNLLYPIHLGGDAEVTEIKADGIGVRKMGDIMKKSFVGANHIHRLEPIPLTEQWLVKFGFEKKHVKMSIAEYDYYIKDKNEIFLIKDGFELQIFAIDDVFNLGRTYKYVHQLQNLYFALTGEELKLRE